MDDAAGGHELLAAPQGREPGHRELGDVVVLVGEVAGRPQEPRRRRFRLRLRPQLDLPLDAPAVDDLELRARRDAILLDERERARRIWARAPCRRRRTSDPGTRRRRDRRQMRVAAPLAAMADRGRRACVLRGEAGGPGRQREHRHDGQHERARSHGRTPPIRPGGGHCGTVSWLIGVNRDSVRGLQSVQFGIHAVAGHQRVVRALLGQAQSLMTKMTSAWRIVPRWWAMTTDVRPFISLSRASITACSEAASRPDGGFVENQDRRVADDGAGDRDALALAARQRDAALADHRVVAVGHRLDELVRVGQFGRAPDLPGDAPGLP